MEQEVWRDAQKMEDKVSSDLLVAVCATKLDLVELECSFKSAMRRKIRKNMINFVKKFFLTSVGVSLL